MSAGRVKAGAAFVEVGADARKFFATLDRVKNSMANVGKSISGAGARMAGMGALLAAPFAASARAGAQFQDVLLNLKASTGATAAELNQIRTAAMNMSKQLGVGPTEAAAGFLELLKAGLSLETVLGGAGAAALAFSKVAGLDGATAATVLSKAMNAFGTDAGTAANAMSSAADASATSIEEMAQAFSQASAVAATSNQSITDLSAALAVLANKGIVGSDAGTSIKTMLQKLKVPTTDAEKALAKVGLAFDSFRGADGQLLPLVDIIRVLNGALADVGQATRDDVLGNVFGSDAIRAATILTQVGVDGFNAMQTSMSGAMSVGDKFSTMMGGLSGGGAAVMAAMERLAIAVSDAVAPALSQIMAAVAGVAEAFSGFVGNNEELVGGVGGTAIALIGLGGAFTFLGGAIQAVSFAFGGFSKLAAVALSPVGLAVGGIALGFGAAYAAGIKLSDVGDAIKSNLGGLSGSMGPAIDAIVSGLGTVASDAATVFGDLYSTATTTFGGIADALAAGDLAGAGEMLMAGLSASFQRGMNALMSYVDPFVTYLQDAFSVVYTSTVNAMDGMWTWVGQSFTSGVAFVQGVMDNAANALMATWDGIVASIQKGWLYVRSFMESGLDLDKELANVDSEVKARAAQREKSRPGIGGRTKEADRANAASSEALAKRQEERTAAAGSAMNDRQDRNRQRAAERAGSLAAAEGNMTAKRDHLAAQKEALALIPKAAQASDIASLQKIMAQAEGLRGRGVGSAVLDKMEAAVDDRALELDKARASAPKAAILGAGVAGAAAAAPVDPEAVRMAATAAAASQSEVAGSFSAASISGMGFGQSLAQKQLDALQKIEQNTRDADGGVVKD
jgi:TP901 family phage tail tape measure protein